MYYIYSVAVIQVSMVYMLMKIGSLDFLFTCMYQHTNSSQLAQYIKVVRMSVVLAKYEYIDS